MLDGCGEGKRLAVVKAYALKEMLQKAEELDSRINEIRGIDYEITSCFSATSHGGPYYGVLVYGDAYRTSSEID